MSLTQPEQGDSRAVSPGLTLNLSSNNPFRNRAASPAFSSRHASPLEPPRPVSRNPFLDSNSAVSSFPQPPVRSPDNMAFGDSKEAPRPALTGNAAELFDNLSLEDKPTTRRPPPPRSNTNENDNLGPRRRPSRSQEEAMRARKPGGPSSRPRPPKDELNIFADPSDSPKKERRARRNSESSVARDKPLDSDEEKRRQERRRRERERRHQERKTGKKPKNLDVIDKLDVTSIYGTGLFHHDGPFDACNPDRNRKGSQRAPMSAFAKDSLNNVLGGGGPLNKNPDHSTLMGYHDDDAFQDFSGAANDPYGNGAIRPDGPARNQSHIVDALSRVEPIHGDESLGLGTSTFLEGAPASYKAIQQNKAEQAQSGGLEGGLGRKKSLAQKIRGISNNRREYGPAGRITSPDGVYSPEPPAYTPGGSKINDKDPFAAEFSSKDRGETSITIAEPDRKQGRARAPSSPRRGSGGFLERRMTSEGIAGADQASAPAKSGGGFLTRMKSLKGGPRKPRDGPKIPASQPEAV